MAPLRLAFLGTPDFAVPSLAALAAAGHEIAAVYSQPARPAGRGQKPRPAPVARLAEARGWPLMTPAGLRDPAEVRAFADLGLDAAVVVAYGLILPPGILAAPRLGCLNVHASLLPRWRGAAPIQRALLAGDRETGVTIMQMDAGLDSGAILLQQAVPVDVATTAGALHDRLARLGAELIVRALAELAAGRLQPRAQDESGATYAAKLSREEGRLDWRRPAAELARRVRALGPWPGAFAELDGLRLKVLAAEAVPGRAGAPPGQLLDRELTVACGEAALRLLRVQRPGKAPLGGAELLRGLRLAPGACLPLPPSAQP